MKKVAEQSNLEYGKDVVKSTFSSVDALEMYLFSEGANTTQGVIVWKNCTTYDDNNGEFIYQVLYNK